MNRLKYQKQRKKQNVAREFTSLPSLLNALEINRYLHRPSIQVVINSILLFIVCVPWWLILRVVTLVLLLVTIFRKWCSKRNLNSELLKRIWDLLRIRTSRAVLTQTNCRHMNTLRSIQHGPCSMDRIGTDTARLTRTKGLFHKWDINLQLNYFNFDKVANDIDLPNLLKHLLEDSTVLEKLNVSDIPGDYRLLMLILRLTNI